MNKRQRLKMIQQYDGLPRLVFERRLKSLKANANNQGFTARVEYSINTKRFEETLADADTALQAARIAWKRAKLRFEENANWYLSRGWLYYDYSAADIPQVHNIEAVGHLLGLDRDGLYRCEYCWNRYKEIPKYGDCPKVPVFHGLWNKAFANAQEKLGFKPLTKKQLNDAGYQTGKKLPAPCAAFDYSESASGYLFAYNPADATPKKVMTDAQRAAIEKAQYMAKSVLVTCAKCKHHDIEMSRKKSLDPEWQDWVCDYCSDGLAASEWARDVLSNPDKYIILDTETTDLDGEIIDIGILSLTGEVLLSQRIKPLGAMSEGAQAIHGISLDDLKDEPSFAEVYPKIREAVAGKTLIIYSADFDLARLWYDCNRHSLGQLDNKAECAMEMYSQYVGDWSNYWGNYKWQRLPGGDHTAIGDCRATLGVLREMVRDLEEWESNTVSISA